MSNADTFPPVNGLTSAPEVPARLRNTVWQRLWGAKVFYNFLLVVATAVGKTGLSPDAITLTSLAISIGAAACLARGCFLSGAALLVLSGTLDLLDGAVARITGKSSRWGALLDSSVDRIADALPLVGLILVYTSYAVAQLPLLVSIVLGFTISYVRARAEALDIELPSMFMRRAERLLILVACLLLGALKLPALDATLRVPHAPMFVGLCVATLLNAIGCIAILYVARQKLTTSPAGTAEAAQKATSDSPLLNPTQG